MTRAIVAAASAASLGAPTARAGGAGEGGAGARTRVVLLPVQSYALPAQELDAISRLLAERFRSSGEIELVDAAPVLAEKASADWLRADKLLYDGIQDYQNLEFARAVEELRESGEIMERTFRELADAQGRRRLRDAYLHLGLARLEQKEQAEAEGWFARAARVDPSFEPDPRAFPPVVRARFLAAKTERLDDAYEAGRERMRDLARLVGVDVVVAGGVRHDPSEHGGGWFVEIAWVDRWSGRSAVEAVASPAGTREALVEAVRDASPRILAGVLQRPWPPIAGARRVRRRLVAGAAGAVLPDARVVRAAGGGQVYRWSDNVYHGGLHVAIAPWEGGPWSVETDVTVFFPRKMAPAGWETTFHADGKFEGAGSLGARAVRTFRRDRWGLSGGVGIAFNESIASFRSAQTETGVVFLWLTPVASLSATRRIPLKGSVETFVELKVAAEYDVLGSGPADWMLQSVAAGGVAF